MLDHVPDNNKPNFLPKVRSKWQEDEPMWWVCGPHGATRVNQAWQIFFLYLKKKIKINKKKKKKNERGEERKRDTVGVFLGESGYYGLFLVQSPTHMEE